MRIALRAPGAVLAERARSGGWWARVAATRRDLQMVLRDLRGQHPPPLVPRAATPGAAPTALPGAAPTATPGATPTALPGAAPTALPGAAPTAPPGAAPTALPGAAPTALRGAAAQAEVAGARPATPGGPHRVTLLRGGGQVEVMVPAGRTILEACLAVGLAMEFSCGMGGCGTCRVRLVSGTVDLDAPNCLTPEERERGLVLACVARPRGACTIAGRG